MSLTALLAPRAIAVVGASQRQSRGSTILKNLRTGGFTGNIYPINPRYEEVLGYRCYPSVSAVPDDVESVVCAVGAAATCDVLEEAYKRGLRAAVVLASGFGEGESDAALGARLNALASTGMAICGPNCLGLINLHAGVVAYSGTIPGGLSAGRVALISQSGGLGQDAFRSLTIDRRLGFAYFVSCGNQLGVTIEEYADAFLRDPNVAVIGIIAEALKQPKLLIDVGRRAAAGGKSVVLFQPGHTEAGQALARSHTGAVAGDGEVLAAFLRRNGIVQVKTHEELIEAIELFAFVPPDATRTNEVVVVSGSGGAAAVAADVLAENDVRCAALTEGTKQRIRAVLPAFGSVNNPIDGTGAIYDDPSLLDKVFAAIVEDPSRPLVAVAISARTDGSTGNRRFAETMATTARTSGCQFVGYQNTPLGGPLDTEVLRTLNGANIPFLLGASSAMKALGSLQRRDTLMQNVRRPNKEASTAGLDVTGEFMAAREALKRFGIPVVAAELASTEQEAEALFRRFGGRVAVKAEVAGLIHKSDAGCVRLACASADAVVDAYRAVIDNARRAGFADAHQVLIQPMETGIAEAFAGIINDPELGPAVCFGIGGIFVEILKDVTIEMAPLSREEALGMIGRIKGAPLLTGARGGAAGDIEALAGLLVRLGDFAVAHAGRLRSLDLNPIIVKAVGGGVVAVDIALEAL